MKKRGKKKNKNLVNKKKEKKNKKGISTIVVILVFVVLIFLIVGILWVLVRNILNKQEEFSEATSKFFSERVEIVDVQIVDSNVTFGITKLSGKILVKINITALAPPLEVDIFSVVDLSTSMRACHGVTYSCCVNTLGGTSYGTECNDVPKDKGDECVDTCGGVWDDKLTATQDANAELMNVILNEKNSPTSRMGFVAYSNQVISSGTINLTNNTSLLQSTMNSWDTIFWTCICCGVNGATSRFSSQSSEEEKKVMIVMSDGQANVQCSEQGTGDATQDAIQAACDANSTLENLIIYSVGAGIDADQDTLTAIAECGNGKYFAAQDASQLVDIYKDISDEIQQTSETLEQLNYFSVIFKNDTDSYEEIITDIPPVLETKTYVFDLEGKLGGELKRIELYPVIITSSGTKVVGPLLDFWEKQ